MSNSQRENFPREEIHKTTKTSHNPEDEKTAHNPEDDENVAKFTNTTYEGCNKSSMKKKNKEVRLQRRKPAEK